ncbi:DUF4407 domain-containing protein [Flagellimonas oceanensis]|uniref:DUF4407 domain-containing protein n=1 Tax=Flagellimonas oceanensis TaxID=2499163 RepID=UPI001F1A653F|nr:DUF4407 domain-containing protein [Allomuricauda oceanensis]
MKREYYESPKPGKIMQWLWKAAGSDGYILKKCTYSDQVKYACLGGIVVATGFMAALAGGYAIYTIFEPKGSALDGGVHTSTAVMSCFFGVIWGLIIFNIDRFIVAATGKGDGTEAITWQEFTNSLPRIVMGLVIAITISKPMEIRMFKSEIDAELHQEQLEKRKAYEIATKANYETRFNAIDAEMEKIEKERNKLLERLTEVESQYTEEVRIVRPGPKAAALKELMDSLGEKLKTFDKDKKAGLDRLISERLKLTQELDRELAKNQEVASGLDGLLERIKLAHEIAGFWITFFITLLFVVIELTPIFFKMMLIKSPYDFISENVKELIRAEDGIQIKYEYYKDKKGQERNLVIHHQVQRKIDEKVALMAAQSELSDYIIEKWKEREKKNIDENVDAYISESK